MLRCGCEEGYFEGLKSVSLRTVWSRVWTDSLKASGFAEPCEATR